jgi:hypothetical protein
LLVAAGFGRGVANSISRFVWPELHLQNLRSHGFGIFSSVIWTNCRED